MAWIAFRNSDRAAVVRVRWLVIGAYIDTWTQ
jgi:hypothetical protein